MVKKLIFGTLLCILLFLSFVGCQKSTAEFVNSQSASVDFGMETESKTSEDSVLLPMEPKDIYVYVCGAVLSPGVYAIPEGSRVCDLFQQAGGLTEEAARDYWNQARILVDGEMIYVPTKEEAKERSEEDWDRAGSMGTTQDTDSVANRKVNINTASKEELMTLPGIGESKAIAILQYRKEKGGFSSIDELMEIPGIKDGVFSKIKEYLTVN